VRISDGRSIAPRIADVASKNPFCSDQRRSSYAARPASQAQKSLSVPVFASSVRRRSSYSDKASAPAVHRYQVEPTDDDGSTGSDAGFLPYV
jgi:hypothetical protein